MAISNKTGRMVLATGNKSEMAVGYATLYGDMNGGFAPIKRLQQDAGVPAGAVSQFAGRGDYPSVIEREPSAELAPEQRTVTRCRHTTCSIRFSMR